MTPEERAKEFMWKYSSGDEYPLGREGYMKAWADSIRAAITEAVAQERERCAKIAAGWALHYPKDIFIEPPPGQHGETVDACSAAAIRWICPSIAAVIRATP